LTLVNHDGFLLFNEFECSSRKLAGGETEKKLSENEETEKKLSENEETEKKLSEKKQRRSCQRMRQAEVVTVGF
jgi:hypothetical protein